MKRKSHCKLHKTLNFLIPRSQDLQSIIHKTLQPTLVHFSTQPTSSSSNASWTTHACPAKALIQPRQRCAGVPPLRVCSRQLHVGGARRPDCSRVSRQHHHGGQAVVATHMSLAAKSALANISARNTSSCPSCTAKCSGVPPLGHSISGARFRNTCRRFTLSL